MDGEGIVYHLTDSLRLDLHECSRDSLDWGSTPKPFAQFGSLPNRLARVTGSITPPLVGNTDVSIAPAEQGRGFF